MLNPDAVMLPGCLPALLDLARREPEGGLFGGRIYSADGDVDPTSCWGRPTLWSTLCFATGLSTAFASSTRFNPEGIGAWPRDVERPVDIVSGCLLLAERGAWDRLGGFDERFFMYGEDFDLGIRAAQAGYRPMITPEAGITHVGGASSAAVAQGDPPLPREGEPGPQALVRSPAPGGRGAAARRRPAAGPARRRGPSVAPGADERSHRAEHLDGLWHRRAEWRDGWPEPTGAAAVARHDFNDRTLSRAFLASGTRAGGIQSRYPGPSPECRCHSSPGRGRKSVVRDLLTSAAGRPLL